MIISPEQCFKEDMLAAVVHANGLDEVQIEKLTDGEFYLNVKVKSNPKPFYLSTQRKPSEPRRFKKLEPVVSTAYKLFGEDCQLIIKSQTHNQK